MKLTIKIVDQVGEICSGKNSYEEFTRELSSSGTDFCYLATQNYCYQKGDSIVITTSEPHAYLVVNLDECLAPSFVYVPEGQISYDVPVAVTGESAKNHLAFTSREHYISVRAAYPAEIAQYRNLSENTIDQNTFNGCYPHAFANVETRNDSTFFACNTIDGILANNSHGPYPYQSWGINQQADAALTIDFGREVEIDCIALVLRADFPHDSYWSNVRLTFSNGTEYIFSPEKISTIQSFNFQPLVTTKVIFSHLEKAEDNSPFPALTQLMCFGRNI